MSNPAVLFHRRDGSRFVRVFGSLAKAKVSVKAWRAAKGVCKLIC